MEKLGSDSWPKKITVDKRIVSVLSQSTYTNFPRALKELITNSYDADARRVTILVDLANETISIEDNGRGMTAGDLDFYLRIAGKTRKKEDNLTPLGREIIGQFGVGFLAVFPFFKNYSIESKKAGSASTVHANIPLSKYFSDDKRLIDVSSILINGGVTEDRTRMSQSFTKIVLSGFNDLTKSFFFRNHDDKKRKNKNSVETYEGLEKLEWILSDDLPVRFSEEKYNRIFGLTDLPPFEVYLNGKLLTRQIYGTDVLEAHKGDYHQIGRIRFRYCITTPRKSVSPDEARFLKIRNLNVGVGEQREHFGTKSGATRSRMHWLTGEVHILEGMNDLISIARDSFSYSADYEDLKDFLNERLQYYSNRLERESNLRNEIKQTGTDFRVSNVKLLNPERLSKEVKKFEEEGFEVKALKSKKPEVLISEEKKEIILSADLADFQKHLVVDDKKYLVTSSTWKVEGAEFPACKIEGNTITVNAAYPLFSGRKFTDVFVKLHLLLLSNLKAGILNKQAYHKLTEDVLIYYSDYTKQQ